MKLFITGGTGMVGRNLCNLANKQGYQVIAPTRAELDLANLTAIVTYLRKTKPDIIIHCAGLVGGIKANMDAQYDFCYQNLLLGMNVIQASYQAGITKLINLSSSRMYPKSKNPIKESQILHGLPEHALEGYAVAKIAVAQLAKSINLQYGMQYKTYILCNLYGFWDNYNLKTSNFIAAIIKKIQYAIADKQSTVVIWADGSARREVLFAEDLADFILFSLQNFSSIPNIINVGSGVDYTINQYYQTVAKVLGYKGKFSHDLTKPAGVKKTLLNISKLKALGWQPKTSLESGISKAYKFYVNKIIQTQLHEELI